MLLLMGLMFHLTFHTIIPHFAGFVCLQHPLVVFSLKLSPSVTCDVVFALFNCGNELFTSCINVFIVENTGILFGKNVLH